ncbi:MAG: helix-turn-helix domain-containing protein [Planctomycetota bacterium]
MAKKYLSLEEAASQLGMTTDQLMRIREQGEIRGFADRGSWKFREQDIEEFLRSRQADSSPDMPIISGNSSSSVLDEPEVDLASSDSDVRLFFDESMFEGDDAGKVKDSGSDVRLTGDSGPKLEADADDEIDLSGWDSDAKLSDSDSDVQLVGAATEAEVDLGSTDILGKEPVSDDDVLGGSFMSDSDSDVLLATDSDLNLSDSDSDVRLSDDTDKTNEMTFTGADSDSDVKLMGSDDLLLDDSDSDVKLSAGLDRTDSDIRLADAPSNDGAATMALPAIPDDSDLKLINKGSGVRGQAVDSGISLDVRGSGLGLDADESGISLEIDSGISLDADDSGISLESFDSGAVLNQDSGISLDAGDSGISLDLKDDRGMAMESTDMSRTMPMQAIPGARNLLSESQANTTQMEIPQQPYGKDSEFELAGLDDDDDDVGTNTSVLTFEDENESAPTVAVPVVAAASAPKAAAKAPAKKKQVEEEEFAEDSYEDDDGGFDDEGFDDEEFDGDELDAHDAEDFEDEDFTAGQSQVGGFPTRAAARPDVDWGMGLKVMIGLSTVLSLLCAVIGVELVRTMWLWTQPGQTVEKSGILDMIGGFFGS